MPLKHSGLNSRLSEEERWRLLFLSRHVSVRGVITVRIDLLDKRTKEENEKILLKVFFQ